MTKIGNNIRNYRELKNYTLEYMADMLGMNQSSYSKLENENHKISIDRLLKIAEVLEVDVNDLINSAKLNIYNQTNETGSYGNGYIENLHIENKEILDKLLQAKDEILEAQKEQIALLKALLQQKS